MFVADDRLGHAHALLGLVCEGLHPQLRNQEAVSLGAQNFELLPFLREEGRKTCSATRLFLLEGGGTSNSV